MENISIDEIKVDNQYLRVNSDVDKLKKSIETIGLINPITINENKYLLAGGRRYKAMKELGYNTVPVRVICDNDLKQELVSIDENLVRQDLTRIEMERYLNRGREIYEQLNPQAIKVEEEDVTKVANQKINEELPEGKKSFLDLTSEKTGLSKKSIKQAIERDQNSSEKVKQLRSNGELNASQANALIKLDKQKQDLIVDYIVDKPAKQVKKLVDAVRTQGVDEAITNVVHGPSIPKEYEAIINLTKRFNRMAGKITLEEMYCGHPDMKNVAKLLKVLKVNVDKILELNDMSDFDDNGIIMNSRQQQITENTLN